MKRCAQQGRSSVSKEKIRFAASNALKSWELQLHEFRNGKCFSLHFAVPKRGRKHASPVTIIRTTNLRSRRKLAPGACWNAALMPFHVWSLSRTLSPAWETYIKRGSHPSLLMCTVRSVKISNAATDFVTASNDVRKAFGLVTRPPSRATDDRCCIISQLAKTCMMAIR